MKSPRTPITQPGGAIERMQPIATRTITPNAQAKHQTGVASLVDLVNASPQVMQQKQQALTLHNSPHQQHLQSLQAHMAGQPIQLKTEIKHLADYVDVNNNGTWEKHEVGKSMEAALDFREPVVGSATGVNWTWMQALRRQYSNANVIRGHLLNHDLGGFGANHNLYPISTKANMEHSDKVEQLVKGQLYDDKKSLEPKRLLYKVEVRSDAAHNPAKASFECTWGHEGGAQLGKESIKSDLGKDANAPYRPKLNPKVSPKSWRHGKGRGDTNHLGKTTANYRAAASPDASISVAKSTDLQGVTVVPNVNATPMSKRSERLWEDSVVKTFEDIKTNMINAAAINAVTKLTSPTTVVISSSKTKDKSKSKGIKTSAVTKPVRKKRITQKEKEQAIKKATDRIYDGIDAFVKSKQLDTITQSSLTRLMNAPDDILKIQQEVINEIDMAIRHELTKIP